MGLAGSCSWGGPLGSRRSTGRTIGITESGHSMPPRLSPAPHSACTCVSFHIALILFLQRRLCHMVRIMAPGNPNLEIPVKKKKRASFLYCWKSIPEKDAGLPWVICLRAAGCFPLNLTVKWLVMILSRSRILIYWIPIFKEAYESGPMTTAITNEESGFSKATWLLIGETGIWTPVVWLHRPCSYSHVTILQVCCITLGEQTLVLEDLDLAWFA